MTGRMVGFAVSFFIPVVLVRIFAPSEFGTYRQLFLIYSTLYGIAQFGMAESLYYFLPGASTKGGRYVVNAMLVLSVVGLASFVLLGATGASLSRWLNNAGMSRYFPLIGIFMLLVLISTVLEIVMIARKRYGLASFSYAVSEIARAGFFMIPVLLLRDLKGLLIGAVIFAFFRCAAALLYLYHEFKADFRPDSALLKEQFAYALPFQLAVVVEILQANFHQYAVSYRFDVATFALYSVGCLQIPLIDFVASSASNVMMVRMTDEIRQGRVATVLSLWHDTVGNLALFFFPLVGLLLLNARPLIVFLFTIRYLPSVPVFMIMSIMILFAVFPTDSVIRVFAQTRFLFLLNAVRLILIAASIGWFLSTFGLIGAALVTVTAAFVAKGLALVRLKSMLGVGFPRLLPWRKLITILGLTCAAVVPSLIVKTLFDISPLPALLLTGVVYTVSYLTLLMGFGFFDEVRRLSSASVWQRLGFGRAKAG